jgi:hypothetical protein
MNPFRILGLLISGGAVLYLLLHVLLSLDEFFVRKWCTADRPAAAGVLCQLRGTTSRTDVLHAVAAVAPGSVEGSHVR